MGLVPGCAFHAQISEQSSCGAAEGGLTDMPEFKKFRYVIVNYSVVFRIDVGLNCQCLSVKFIVLVGKNIMIRWHAYACSNTNA